MKLVKGDCEEKSRYMPKKQPHCDHPGGCFGII